MRPLVMIAMLVALEAGASAEPSAEQLYNEGQHAFDRGDYPTAIARWQSSYRLSKLPLLVLNIAQAYRAAGDCAHALPEFQRYIALDPTGQRRLADDAVGELSAQCGPQTQGETVDAASQPVEKRSRTGHDMKIAGLVTGGAGVVVLATGLVFGRLAVSLGDEVMNDCSPPSPPCQWSNEKGKQSDGQRDATIGKVLDVVGVAAIAAGIGLYIYGARDGDHALMIQPHSSGATMSWSGRW